MDPLGESRLVVVLSVKSPRLGILALPSPQVVVCTRSNSGIGGKQTTEDALMTDAELSRAERFRHKDNMSNNCTGLPCSSC